jgi:hypothetical protein
MRLSSVVRFAVAALFLLGVFLKNTDSQKSRLSKVYETSSRADGLSLVRLESFRDTLLDSTYHMNRFMADHPDSLRQAGTWMAVVTSLLIIGAVVVFVLKDAWIALPLSLGTLLCLSIQQMVWFPIPFGSLPVHDIGIPLLAFGREADSQRFLSLTITLTTITVVYLFRSWPRPAFMFFSVLLLGVMTAWMVVTRACYTHDVIGSILLAIASLAGSRAVRNNLVKSYMFSLPCLLLHPSRIKSEIESKYVI